MKLAEEFFEFQVKYMTLQSKLENELDEIFKNREVLDYGFDYYDYSVEIDTVHQEPFTEEERKSCGELGINYLFFMGQPASKGMPAIK